MFSLLSAIWNWRRPQHRHPCIVVAPIIDGERVASFNRRVLSLRPSKRTVETGDVGAVKGGGGKIVDEEFLGRVTTTLAGNLELVQKWVEELYAQSESEINLDVVIDGVKEQIAASEMPPAGESTIQLDIFKATIVNAMEDKVFVFRTASSL